MEKVFIEKVYISDKKKDGEEFKTKDGRTFWKVGIKTSNYDNWLSALAFKEDAPEMKLREGEEQTIVVSENNGYLNFKLPTKHDMVESRVEKLEETVGKLQNALKTIDERQRSGGDSIEYPEPGAADSDGNQTPNPEDIPF